MSDGTERLLAGTDGRTGREAAGAGFPTSPGWRGWSGGLSGLPTSIGAAFDREMEAGRGFLWLPVFFGLGILAYFALPREPSAVALCALAAFAILAAVLSRPRIALFRLALAFALFATGAAAIKIRTDLRGAPRLEREVTAILSGFVAEKTMAQGGGARVVLRVHDIDEVDAPATPRFVRVTVRTGAEAIAVGDAIEVTAALRPPNGPAIPGGYDFARAAYYERLGAVGFAYGAARAASIGEPPLSIRLARPLQDLREAIGRRAMSVLPGDPGRIAAALIMGDQGGISETTQEAMRESGLGHVFSISGLHMALVAGTAFWLLRALFALSAELALRRPIKKWAAAGALAVATFYLGISGAGVATERAYVMLAIMLSAILLDRRAITLRNVAIAALVVLAMAPESLLSASFQMSFAATVALVAAYEELSARADRRLRLADRRGPGFLAWAGRAAGGLFVTSLVAGLATTPFAIYHFQRAAPLSLIANMLAMPAVGLVVMPMALLAVLFMPFGLESVPLAVMDWGISWMLSVAHWTAAWSGAAGSVHAVPAVSLLLASGGFLWLALWRERWRLAGLAPMIVAIPVALAAPRPDILVSGDASAFAVRGADGRYAIQGARADRFVVENWLRADADPRPPDDPGLSGGIACDPAGCVAHLAPDGELLAQILKPDAFAEDCRLAAIVVSWLAAPEYCAETATVVDRARLDRRGAHALYRTGLPAGSRFRIETAWPAVPRPWMPGFNSDG